MRKLKIRARSKKEFGSTNPKIDVLTSLESVLDRLHISGFRRTRHFSCLTMQPAMMPQMCLFGFCSSDEKIWVVLNYKVGLWRWERWRMRNWDRRMPRWRGEKCCIEYREGLVGQGEAKLPRYADLAKSNEGLWSGGRVWWKGRVRNENLVVEGKRDRA